MCHLALDPARSRSAEQGNGSLWQPVTTAASGCATDSRANDSLLEGAMRLGGSASGGRLRSQDPSCLAAAFRRLPIRSRSHSKAHRRGANHRSLVRRKAVACGNGCQREPRPQRERWARTSVFRVLRSCRTQRQLNHCRFRPLGHLVTQVDNSARFALQHQGLPVSFEHDKAKAPVPPGLKLFGRPFAFSFSRLQRR